MLQSLVFVNILTWIAMVAVLMWVFRLTRLPAAAVYLVWFVVGQLILPWGQKAILDSFLRSGASWSVLPGMSTGTLVAVMSMIGNVIGTGLLIWLLVSLVRWAAPEAALRWPISRVPTTPAVEQ